MTSPAAALRATSVYSLRVATDADDPFTLMADLTRATEAAGLVVTDTHHVDRTATPYVSVSFRLSTSDAAATEHATHLLDEVTRGPREAYLHTGLVANRRVITEWAA